MNFFFQYHFTNVISSHIDIFNTTIKFRIDKECYYFLIVDLQIDKFFFFFETQFDYQSSYSNSFFNCFRYSHVF